MYNTIMAMCLIAIFVLYVICAAGADRREYEEDLKRKYGDNP